MDALLLQPAKFCMPPFWVRVNSLLKNDPPHISGFKMRVPPSAEIQLVPFPGLVQTEAKRKPSSEACMPPGIDWSRSFRRTPSTLAEPQYHGILELSCSKPTFYSFSPCWSIFSHGPKRQSPSISFISGSRRGSWAKQPNAFPQQKQAACCPSSSHVC